MRIDILLAFIIAFFGLICVALIFVASIVALFKIDEADRYYGVGKLGHNMPLKGLPFSLNRMTSYGLVILFKEIRVVQKWFASELEEITINAPPKHLERLLVWLYASWILCVVPVVILGGILMTFF